ncbi:MAG: secretin N-terminal domain-containing protein [Candidatus Melainabacteria bacterium]|nr:secretin N-terminal domain-containing protein [Candidatus Melainabacteria bacterium]
MPALHFISQLALAPFKRPSSYQQFGCGLLAACIGLTQLASIPASAWAQHREFIRGDISLTVSPQATQKAVIIPHSNRLVHLSFRNVPLDNVLQALAKVGGFNVAVDESVEGNLSVDLHGVTLKDALESVKSYGKLAYQFDGNTLMVADADSPKAKAFHRSNTKVFPLKHANAKLLADTLNKILYQDVEPKPIMADPHTNSLVAVGSPSDLQVVGEHLQALDQARQMKTWRLSHGNALDVATLLSSSVFNDGMMPALIVAQGGGGGGGAAGGAGGGAGVGGAAGGMMQGVGSMPSTLRVRSESIEEGEGSTTQGAGGGSGGGASGTSAAQVTSDIKLRQFEKTEDIAQINPTGPIIIPDTRLNAITLLGTAEQIAMAESMIPTFDRRLPQVVIEAALIEISNTKRKDLGTNITGNQEKVGFNFNNASQQAIGANRAFSQAINGMETAANVNPLTSLFRFSTRPLVSTTDFSLQLNALIRNEQAKVLAHPTIVATHDSEAIIRIVDEIIKSETRTVTGLGGANVGTQANIGEAGIVLNLVPKIAPNGTITLRVRPTVSSVSQVVRDAANTVTLLKKREILAQEVMMQDGQSMVLGGFVQDTDSDVLGQIPGLSQLPIIGALGRSSTRTKNKTELVIVLTPHVINDDPVNTMTQTSSAGHSAVSFDSQPGQILRQGLKPSDMATPNTATLSRKGYTLTPLLPELQPVSVMNPDRNNVAPETMPQIPPLKRPGSYPTGAAGNTTHLKREVSSISKPTPRTTAGKTTERFTAQNARAKTTVSPGKGKPLDTSDEAMRAIMMQYLGE